MNRKPMSIIMFILCFPMILALASCGAAPSAGSNSDAATENEIDRTVDDSTKNTVAKSTKKSGGKKVYFAGPLFCQSEKDYNLKVAKLLEDNGYEVFLPQRDGYLAAELEGLSEKELVNKIFKKDYSEIMNADIILMNLDGRVPDEGACVELGIAYESGKRCYGFMTDSRSVERGLDLNPLIDGCMLRIFKNFNGDKMLEELQEYLSENEL